MSDLPRTLDKRFWDSFCEAMSRVTGRRWTNPGPAQAELSTDSATCAAGCGQPLILGEPHYTVVRTVEVVEADGTVAPLDGDELAFVHIDCWPANDADVVIAATVNAPGTSTVRSAVAS
jgi:hypothetical protein